MSQPFLFGSSSSATTQTTNEISLALKQRRFDLFIRRGQRERFATVFAIIPGRDSVLLKVFAQAGEGPALFESESFHLITGSFGRQAKKVDFVKSGDERRAVASEGAMKVDGPQALVGQKAENLTDVFFRGRNLGPVQVDGDHIDTVFAGLMGFQTVEQRKESHFDDVLDLLGLQEPVISVALGL